MQLTVIISILIAVIIIALIAVFGVYEMIGINQRLTDNVNGHTVEVKTGDGFARISVDGKVADEIRWLWKFSSTLQCTVDGACVEVNIRKDFCRYRITTLVDGSKNEDLSN